MDIYQKIVELLLSFGPRLISAIILLIVGLWVIKIVIRVLDKSLQKSSFDVSLHAFSKSVTSFALKALLLTTVASFLGIPMTTFAAVLAAAGLAIGFALKDSLSNFAGGVLILVFRPFSVGDFIEAQGYMGTVKGIQILYTYLTTPDNRRVVIPNGELANAKVVNFSAESTRRVDLVFGIGYDDDLLKAKEVLNRIVREHPLTIDEPEPLIKVAEHADSSINFNVRMWCEAANYWQIYYDMHELVKLEFDKENIGIPYPQMDVHMHNN